MIQLFRFLILGAFLLATTHISGQQVTFFNSSIINPYSINPAKAGDNGNQVFIQHRNQWVDVPGSPASTMLTTEWRLKESKTAIGFKMVYDVDNIIKNTTGYFTYAYHTSLGGKHSLSAGLSFGIRNNSIMFDKIIVDELDDPVLFGYNQSGTKFDGDFGFSYHYDKLEFQFSALQLMANNSSYYNSSTEQMFEYNFIRNYVSSVAYTFTQVQDFEFTPIVQVRGLQGYNLQPEVIVKAEYLEQFSVAAHYLHNRSVAFSMGVHIQDMYTISYSAEISTQDLASYNGGTHEITFGVKFGNAFDRTQTKHKLEKIQRSTNSYDERLEYLKRENDKMKKQMEAQQQYYEQMKDNTADKNYDELKNDIEQIKKDQEELKARPVLEVQEKEELEQMMEENAGVVEFERGKTVLKETSFSALNEIVQGLEGNLNSTITIEGHTDNIGNDEANIKISEERAMTVKNYLVAQGVSSNQIFVVGKGSSEPKEDNSTAQGRSANRRVEIILN